MKRTIVAYVLFILLLPILGKSQTVINTYARVTAISGNTLTISNATGSFSAGKAIIMQMKDSVIQTSILNNSSFGNIDNIGKAGISEVVTISSVSGTTITLSASPANTYNLSVNARVQLISYPTLGAGLAVYTLNNNLTATAWDGNVGGVLAFNVNGTLVLNGNLIVDGLGYKGGSVGVNAPGDFSCDPNTYKDTANGVSTTYYGFKGEGIYVSTNKYTVAKGKLANGGGGGNYDNAGGGGGGNFTAGGSGGYGWSCTSTTNGGGLGGADLSSYTTASRFFMGGGGGGGQQNNNVGTAGANGGGIIMIKASAIQTNSGCTGGAINISAQGSNAANSGNDGSGGGGAGGSVLIQATSYTVNNACPINILTSGGNGGTVQNSGSHGGGGGGGRGAVIFSPQSTTPANITLLSAGGTGGGNSTSSGTLTGGNGSTTSISGGSGVIYSTGSTLPVTLLSFTASYNNTSASLNWSSGAEVAFSHYEVERSINSPSNFTTLGSVASKGSDSEYGFTDDLSFISGAAVVYYRLKIVNIDGIPQYSDIRILRVGTNSLSAKAYPVPTHSVVNISLNVPANLNSLQVSIRDMQGRMVKNLGTVSVSAGSPLSISLEGLAAGQYIVELGNAEYNDRAIIIKL
ncbi:MAG: T9SS type A sorting domain-containing protein [Bacteroidetes bacterium]|nr:T9SS type A sorting domain-containing protein [Bacteroidota bacterium]